MFFIKDLSDNQTIFIINKLTTFTLLISEFFDIFVYCFSKTFFQNIHCPKISRKTENPKTVFMCTACTAPAI